MDDKIEDESCPACGCPLDSTGSRLPAKSNSRALTAVQEIELLGRSLVETYGSGVIIDLFRGLWNVTHFVHCDDADRDAIGKAIQELVILDCDTNRHESED